MLSTLPLPTEGEIYVDGSQLTRKKPELKCRFSVVTQEYSMRQDMTVDEIMEYQGRLMYLTVFGIGVQTMSHGEPYLHFLIPGVVSLTTMNGSFNAIAQNLNVPRFSNYIIIPMAYLCNTFFSKEQMPHGLREAVGILPLSQTSAMIRSIANGEGFSVSGVLILLVYLIVFGALAFVFLYQKKNL